MANDLPSHPSARRPPDDWHDRRPAMIRAGGMTINADWQDVLRSAGLTDLEAVFNFASGQSLTKPGLPAHRTRDRIELGGRVIYLKRYRPTILGWIVRCLLKREGGTEASAEWAALHRLAEGGVLVPEPVLFGERAADEGRPPRSCVALAELPDAESLERWLPRQGPALAPDQRRELLTSLADFVAQFHRLGVVHRDLYLSHIFIRWAAVSGSESGRAGAALPSPAPAGSPAVGPEDGPAHPCPGPIFWLIDLARVFRPARWRRTRWVVKDLAQLRYSLGEMIQDGEWDALLRRYIGRAGPPDGPARLAGRIHRKVQRISRHARARLVK